MGRIWTTAALLAGLALLGCARDRDARTAQDRERSQAAEVGAEAGEELDRAADEVAEGAEDVVDELGLRGRHRYRCATGEEFTVEFRNDGESALVEKQDRQYWLEREEGTGRYSARQARFWTLDEDLASLELPGQPLMRNCTRQ